DGIRDRNVTGVQTCALPICEGKSEVFVLEGGGVRGAGIEVNGTGLPNTPRLGRAQSHFGVRVGQPSSVGLDEIAPFTLGNGFEELSPLVWEHMGSAAVVEPVQLRPSQGEHPTKDDARNPLGV